MEAKVVQRERARELARQGTSYSEIVRQLGVSKSSVSKWCRDIVEELVATGKIKAPKKVDQQRRVDRNKVLELCRSKIPRQEIANTLHIGLSTVHRICKGMPTVRKIAPPTKPNPLLGTAGVGPYEGWHLYFSTDRQGAKTVNMVNVETRERKGMRYARYLMSVHLNRVLTKTETVRYKNGIKDVIENLEIKVLQSETSSSDPNFEKKCDHCGKDFVALRTAAKFCGDDCRALSRKARYKKDRTCRGCKENFSSDSRSDRYCGSTCKEKYAPPKSGRRIKSARTKVEKRVCVVCEGNFTPNTHSREHCYSKYCNDVIQAEILYES